MTRWSLRSTTLRSFVHHFRAHYLPETPDITEAVKQAEVTTGIPARTRHIFIEQCVTEVLGMRDEDLAPKLPVAVTRHVGRREPGERVADER